MLLSLEEEEEFVRCGVGWHAGGKSPLGVECSLTSQVSQLYLIQASLEEDSEFRLHYKSWETSKIREHI